MYSLERVNTSVPGLETLHYLEWGFKQECQNHVKLNNMLTCSTNTARGHSVKHVHRPNFQQNLGIHILLTIHLNKENCSITFKITLVCYFF